MGGHGGLNILPQKRWNVYNFDNREKVRKDEEAAAKEEQLKREDSRKRDAEFRLERLRTARGLAPLIPEPQAADLDSAAPLAAEPTPSSEPAENGNHINLFEGIRIFDLAEEAPERSERREKSEERSKKRAKKEEVRVVTAEDEKYRLGYGLAGKGVKVPWYLEKKGRKGEEEEKGEERIRDDNVEKKRKKSLEELREERLKREKREKKREQDLLRGKDCLRRDRERLRERDDGSGSRYFSTRWRN